MRRTIPILRGLAILGVVLNHANWHVLSRLTAGDVHGYLFVAFDQIGKFAIPAFMAITGYFIAYATSGGFGQYCYLNWRHRTVIVAFSCWMAGDDFQRLDHTYWHAFQQITEELNA